MDELLREFLTETNESLAALDADLVRFEKSPDAALLQNIFRLFHTIKGTCGFLALPRLEALAHAAETVLNRLRDGELVAAPAVAGAVIATIDRIKDMLAAIEAHGAESAGDDGTLIARLAALGAGPADAKPEVEPVAASTDAPSPAPSQHTIRVDVERLDSLMTLVSELVLTRNELLQVLRSEGVDKFAAPLERLSKLTSALQDGVTKTRMQPIGGAWSKLPRLARDLEHELGKTIVLELHGADTELDRQVLELIRDPLTHMVRNAADHGIETPDERERCGKPRAGRIVLDAMQKGASIVIEIADDGRGLALDRIKARALALGLATEGELAALSEQQMREFVFRPGFSTAAAVTSVSGRGVGLDVVRANIERLGGAIEIASVAGQGTRFSIVLPLTLAIVPALVVASGGERFALPRLAVQELVSAGAGAGHRIEFINRAAVLRWRGRLLPLVSLKRLLRLGEDAMEGTALVVVTEVAGRSFGILVERIDDFEEIVVKPVAPILRGLTLYGGNAILGDGSVIMILDPAGIAAACGGVGVARQPVAVDMPAAHRRESYLVFRAGPGGPKAVKLDHVARLEEIELSAVEIAEGRPVVQYRGRLMRVSAVAPEDGFAQAGRKPMLVFAEDGDAAGLVVDEIEDIVDAAAAIERNADRPGLLGSAIIAGRATDIVDAGFYLARGNVATRDCAALLGSLESALARGRDAA